jgi:hypothetical protein
VPKGANPIRRVSRFNRPDARCRRRSRRDRRIRRRHRDGSGQQAGGIRCGFAGAGRSGGVRCGGTRGERPSAERNRRRRAPRRHALRGGVHGCPRAGGAAHRSRGFRAVLGRARKPRAFRRGVVDRVGDLRRGWPSPHREPLVRGGVARVLPRRARLSHRGGGTPGGRGEHRGRARRVRDRDCVPVVRERRGE